MAAEPVRGTQRLSGGPRPGWDFTRWVIYASRLALLRTEANGPVEEKTELQLQNEVCRDWKPTVADHVLQALRVAKLETRAWLRRI